MISVPIDRIVPLTDARDNFSRLVSDIEASKEGMYVLTKGGKPSIALINIQYLEEIMSGRAEKPLVHTPAKTEPETVLEQIPKPEFKPVASFEPPKPMPQLPPVIQKTEPVKTASFEPKVPANSDTIPEKGPIDPSWTGRPDALPPSLAKPEPTKPVNSPWPILPPRSMGANSESGNSTILPSRPITPNTGSGNSTVLPPTTSPSQPMSGTPINQQPTVPIQNFPINKPSSFDAAPIQPPKPPVVPIAPPPQTAPAPQQPSSMTAQPVPINGAMPTQVIPPKPVTPLPTPNPIVVPDVNIPPPPPNPGAAINFDSPPKAENKVVPPSGVNFDSQPKAENKVVPPSGVSFDSQPKAVNDTASIDSQNKVVPPSGVSFDSQPKAVNDTASIDSQNKVVPPSGISFDSPPKVIPEPGEELPPMPSAATPTPLQPGQPNPATDKPAEAAIPVKDIEI